MTEDKKTSKAPEKAATTAAEAKAPVKKTKKARKNVPNANIFITASYNNTMMSAAEPSGDVLAWASAGGCGFKGSRKATPYAATVTAEKLVEKIQSFGIQKVKVFVAGVGVGREQAIRGLQASGLELEAIFDVTPVPHNGCRKRKSRRV